jgi:hypothetical protein
VAAQLRLRRSSDEQHNKGKTNTDANHCRDCSSKSSSGGARRYCYSQTFAGALA